MGRYKNQIGVIDVDSYDYLTLGIIGVGSIGSFLAVALNKLGFRNLILVDDDIVEDHNVATQFYLKNDIGSRKVHALQKYLDGNTEAYVMRLTPKQTIEADAVFICVDSLKSRKMILASLLRSYEETGKPLLIIDGRMHRLVFRVFTIPLSNRKLLKDYTDGLFEKEFQGECTEKGIIQNVWAVVSVMVEQFKKCIKGEEFCAVLSCDLEHYNYVKTNMQKIKNGKTKKG